MNWNKLRKQMETFIHPSLEDRIEFIPSGYRISPDKKVLAYLKIDDQEILNRKAYPDYWYESEQAVKKDDYLPFDIQNSDLENVRKALGNQVPEDRLYDIAKKQVKDRNAKLIWQAQNQLLKTDFQKAVSNYLSGALDEAISSDDILMNIFAVIDRRTGKKRVQRMNKACKHPLVKYFCRLRG